VVFNHRGGPSSKDTETGDPTEYDLVFPLVLYLTCCRSGGNIAMVDRWVDRIV
jgi:hypothetical protein